MIAGSFSALAAVDAAVTGRSAFSTQPVTVIAFCGRSLGGACTALMSRAALTTTAPTTVMATASAAQPRVLYMPASFCYMWVVSGAPLESSSPTRRVSLTKRRLNGESDADAAEGGRALVGRMGYKFPPMNPSGPHSRPQCRVTISPGCAESESIKPNGGLTLSWAQ